jgi:ABC-type sugar transport system substrate-binding protein
MGRNTWIAAATAVALACGVVACGDDDEAASGSSASSSESSPSDAQQTAADSLAKLTTNPTDVGVDEPLSKAPEAGKTIAVMNCGTPSCTAWAEAAEEAVAAVGWKSQTFDQGTDPQKIGAAWNQVVRLAPDGVMNIGIPKAAIANQLAKLEAADIPVVNSAVGDEPGDGQVAILSGPETALPVGASQADAVVADVGDKAHVVYHTSP